MQPYFLYLQYIEKAKKIEDKSNSHNYHNLKQQLAFQLMVGVEELKSSGVEANIEASESYDSSYQFCCHIAIEIIDSLSKLCKGMVNQKFGDKFRDIFFSLKSEKTNSLQSMNFRQKLVTGELSPAKFANMDKSELNVFVEQKRQMIEENYMKEKIVIEEPDVHFIKTSKGEEIISLSKDSHNVFEADIIENLDCAMMVSPTGSMEKGFTSFRFDKSENNPKMSKNHSMPIKQK